MTNREIWTVDLAIERAHQLLIEAGFVMTTISRKTEAHYYRLNDCPHQLRVATHRMSRPTIGMPHVTAKIFFPPNGIVGKPRLIVMNNAKLYDIVALAIGVYFMRRNEVAPVTYQGRKGTWENGVALPETPERGVDVSESLNKRAVEIAARGRYARHIAANPHSPIPSWENMTSIDRKQRLKWMRTDLEAYFAALSEAPERGER